MIHFNSQDPIQFILKQPNVLTKYTLVIITNTAESLVRKVSKLCWERDVPVLIARAYGMIGYLRLVVPEHESKP